jgi:hypothetical protein
MNINEDYQRDEVTAMAKGVLIGDAFRFIEPSKRDVFFTDKCITAAKRSQTALLSSVDLYFAARDVQETNDQTRAAEYRRKILEGIGIVSMTVQTKDERVTTTEST